MIQFPVTSLLNWYDNNKRALLWRDSSDPYLIWVSEIMLQQTRVDQATPYYERFVARFPNVYSLAQADQQEVLKCWEGLGYYSRARNLHNGARQVVEMFNGNVPKSWNELKSIKGIGDYTASAILSIAFNQPFGVLDGNVIRVLTRYLNYSGDVTKSSVKKELQEFCNQVVSKERPGDFNQAIMELGATVCTPKQPKCARCPLNNDCQNAFSLKTDSIPYKPQKPKVPNYTIVVAIIVDPENNKVLISKRKQDVMLGGLWEFPGGKVMEHESHEQALIREVSEETGLNVAIEVKLSEVKHAYSHFKISLFPFICRYLDGIASPKDSDEVKWVNFRDLDQYPFPKANHKFLHFVKAYLLNNSVK